MATDDRDKRFEQEILQSGRLLFRLAAGILGQAQAAEDACQQALARAWQKRATVQDGSKLRGWLAAVVVNESLAVLRRRKTERKVLEHVSQARPKWTTADDGDVRESVRLGLEQLDERSRVVVVLRLMQGWSGNEVKDFLGVSASEVSRRLHEGIEQLRGILTQDGDLR